MKNDYPEYPYLCSVLRELTGLKQFTDDIQKHMLEVKVMSFAYKKGGYNAYVFSQNNGRLQIKDAVKNYEKPYKGFYVKICRDGVTALSDVSGEYLKHEE